MRAWAIVAVKGGDLDDSPVAPLAHDVHDYLNDKGNRLADAPVA